MHRVTRQHVHLDLMTRLLVCTFPGLTFVWILSTGMSWADHPHHSRAQGSLSTALLEYTPSPHLRVRLLFGPDGGPGGIQPTFGQVRSRILFCRRNAGFWRLHDLDLESGGCRILPAPDGSGHVREPAVDLASGRVAFTLPGARMAPTDTRAEPRANAHAESLWVLDPGAPGTLPVAVPLAGAVSADQGFGQWSPAGELVFSAGQNDGRRRIEMWTPATALSRVLTADDELAITPALSSSGVLLYARLEKCGETRRPSLFSRDVRGDGAAVRVKLGEIFAAHPAWRPPGMAEWIAFSGYAMDGASPTDTAVFVSRADGTERCRVSPPMRGVSFLRPRWSPDGTRIVAQHVRTASGEARVAVLDLLEAPFLTRTLAEESLTRAPSLPSPAPAITAPTHAQPVSRTPATPPSPHRASPMAPVPALATPVRGPAPAATPSAIAPVEEPIGPHLARGLALVEAGEWSGSFTALSLSVQHEHGPGRARALYTRALVAVQLGDIASARRDLDALALAPNSDWAEQGRHLQAVLGGANQLDHADNPRSFVGR